MGLVPAALSLTLQLPTPKTHTYQSQLEMATQINTGEEETLWEGPVSPAPLLVPKRGNEILRRFLCIILPREAWIWHGEPSELAL